MKIATPFLLCSLVFPVLAHGSVDLVDAVDAAFGYDSGISSARNVQSAGHEKRWQGIAALLPNAQFEAHGSKQDQPGAAYAAGVRKHGYSFSVVQPIFDGSRIAEFKRGKVLSEQADIDFAKARQKLIYDVSNAYFGVLFQREVLQAAKAAKTTFGEQLKQATMALSIGEGARTDVDEAQANYDQASAREISAQNNLDSAGTAFGRLTGLGSEDLTPFNWSCMPAGVPVDAATAEDRAADNLDVVSAELQVEQSKVDKLSAASSNLPVVSFQASYGSSWSHNNRPETLGDILLGTNSKSKSTMVGIGVTIPLFSGGAQLSSVREASHHYRAALDAREDALREARQRARVSYLGIINGLALVRAQEKVLSSADSKVKSTRLGRDVGLRNSIDVLNADQQYFEAVRDLADARYKYLKSHLDFDVALGALDKANVDALACRPPIAE
ncbi:type I secretion outer membrane, TolC family protein [Paraburkholderia xenovorans LB400]|uniref:ABC antibiotic efflux pump, outer membrane protein, TolC family n=1 Tax=Paraburkholderia xenovorans (strain LB400) TaxID=266265 RepID=Q13FX9_PARXL|nr:TolC family outer membrane protein [Paraburkholderia xenovorans]ABE37010.1 ABC antibiotic efflux pump, outer membrane protein, TolC family [Paraburkholderia xenovorans LB400]AIP34530.1 type I secretion outer membrane, TolC family protein [Paraburkholderia xenovorans LB400]